MKGTTHLKLAATLILCSFFYGCSGERTKEEPNSIFKSEQSTVEPSNISQGEETDEKLANPRASLLYGPMDCANRGTAGHHAVRRQMRIKSMMSAFSGRWLNRYPGNMMLIRRESI